ncbi:MAG: DUF1499 domain-containing protein [Gemmatimonadota bacterium]|nr:DUF1499 domain-containing protein [Gemmatimonadota bacterium]
MRNLDSGLRYYLQVARHRVATCLFLLAGGCTVSGPLHSPSESEFRALLTQGQRGNIALTAEGHADSTLQPHLYPAAPAVVRGRIISAVLTLPRWQVQDTSGAVLWVTRTTRLFRFVDDLYILVEPRGSGSAVLVRSASRIGQGDLGQNRRNIIELWAALARAPWSGSTTRPSATPTYAASLPWSSTAKVRQSGRDTRPAREDLRRHNT